MSQWNEDVRYLLFDIESAADPELIKSVLYPEEDITPGQAITRYREELMEKKGSDFIPYTYQFPVSLALAKIRGDFSLSEINVLKFEDGGPERIAKNFWDGWLYYKKPTFVTFNGRGFDLPLLELMAFRYGIAIPQWLALGCKSFDQPRNRYNIAAHLDLCDLLTNSGATHFSGGLNLAAKILDRPGKMGTSGDMVQDLFDEGRFDEIHDYCRCDVLDTYFVFLRFMVMSGRINSQDEFTLSQQTLNALKSQTKEHPIYRAYLKEWEKAWKRDSLADRLARFVMAKRMGANRSESEE